MQPHHRGQPRRFAQFAGAATMCLLLVAAAPDPSGPEPEDDGDCVAVGVYYRLGSGDDTYVIGPDHCVRDTHWHTTVERNVEVEQQPVGAVGVGVSLPTP